MKTPSTTVARSRFVMDRALVAPLVAVALALTGAACTSDPSTPAPSATPTLSASPTPTASPPAKPVAAKTKAGAEEFVRYFWRLNNYAYTVRDSSFVAEISDPQCIFCASVIRQLDQLKADGKEFRGGAIDVLTVVSSPPSDGDSVIVATFLRQEAGKILDAKGSVVSTAKEDGPYESFVRLKWDENAWTMGEVDFTSEDGK